ncbi:MAG TPA: hypothetical protein VNT55_08840 [Baekduia sp.]|nr:hypothetical protein [Baekduia sp.]
MKNTLIGGSVATVLAALAFAAPAAQASPVVCNQASPHWLGGGLVALDPPVTSPAARYTVDLTKLPGKGAGLYEAATNSPSLTICDDGGGDNIIVYSETPGDEPIDVADALIPS